MTTKELKISSSEFVCKYCERAFRREKTLFVHVCEAKRRWTSRDDAGPRIGINAFQIFYKSTQANQLKTHEDFVKSPYYLAFVKFGWYVHQIRAVNPMEFAVFLLDNKVKIDWWTKDRYYETYVIEFMKKEAPDDGITRSIQELNRWAEENKTTFDRFFIEASSNKIANLISNGRLSPWFLFSCDQGVAALSNFDEEQLAIAFKWIDPDFWDKKFVKFPDDVKWIRELLDDAGFNND